MEISTEQMWDFPLSIKNEDENFVEDENNLVKNIYKNKNQYKLETFYMQKLSAR